MDKELEKLFDALVEAERAATEAERTRDSADAALQRAQIKLAELRRKADDARGLLMGNVRLLARET